MPPLRRGSWWQWEGSTCWCPALSRDGAGAGWRRAAAPSRTGELRAPLSHPSSCAQQSLTRGGSGGASLPWVLAFSGLHLPFPFSLTCLLLLTTPILSESTQKIGHVSRFSEPLCTRASPNPFWLPIRKVGKQGGSEGQSQNMGSEGAWVG